MIGNEADANRALNDYMTGNDACLFSDQGSTRVVYLINDVIYKVENTTGRTWANTEEWGRYNEIDRTALPGFVRIPEMALYRFGNNTVIAAEKVTGQLMGECFDQYFGTVCTTPEMCLANDVSEILREITEDLAYGNVIAADGCYYMIDIACEGRLTC